MAINFTLTEQGQELLTRNLAGEGVLKFTSFRLGSGHWTGDVKDITDMVTQFASYTFTDEATQGNNTVRLESLATNSGFLVQEELREKGVYAQLGNDIGTNILYSYVSQSAYETLIPAESTEVWNRTFKVLAQVNDATSITVDIIEIKDKYDFNTAGEMIAATYIVDGDRIQLWGYNYLGDGASHKRIFSSVDDGTGIPFNGGYAILENYKVIDARWMGLKSDGSDETVLVQTLANLGKEIYFSKDSDGYVDNPLNEYYFLDTSLSCRITDRITIAPNTRFTFDKTFQFHIDIIDNRDAFKLTESNYIGGGNFYIGKAFQGALFYRTEDGSIHYDCDILIENVSTQCEYNLPNDQFSANCLWNFCKLFSSTIGFWGVRIYNCRIGRGVRNILEADNTPSSSAWITGVEVKNIHCTGILGGLAILGDECNEFTIDGINAQSTKFRRQLDTPDTNEAGFYPILNIKGFSHNLSNIKFFDTFVFFNKDTVYDPSADPYFIYVEGTDNSEPTKTTINNLYVSQIHYKENGDYHIYIHKDVIILGTPFTWRDSTYSVYYKNLERYIPLIGTAFAGIWYINIGKFKIPTFETGGTTKHSFSFKDYSTDDSGGYSQEVFVEFIKTLPNTNGDLFLKLANYKDDDYIRFDTNRARSTIGYTIERDTGYGDFMNIWVKKTGDTVQFSKSSVYKIDNFTEFFKPSIDEDFQKSVTNFGYVNAVNPTQTEPAGFNVSQTPLVIRSGTLSGTTAERPSQVAIGGSYLDTTISKTIWWNGTNWVDSNGTIV